VAVVQEMFSFDTNHLGLPVEIVTLAAAFPLGVSQRPSVASQSLLFQFLPRRLCVTALKGLYYTCSSWM
jgi:hypothetical protein